jgi:hypothetical protein
MPRIRQLIDDLSDAPSEATVVALADAVFMLETSTEKRIATCLDEADAILERLRSSGFDIVRIPPRQFPTNGEFHSNL